MANYYFIPDIFKDVVAKVSTALTTPVGLVPAILTTPVYFNYGHYADVLKDLKAKDGGITTQDKKYPLIWLVMDYVEKKGIDLGLQAQIPNLTILIVTPTTPTDNIADKMVKNFVPILYPIYQELLTQISKEVRLKNSIVSQINHEKIDRPYWGLNSGINGSNGEANLFNDFIDAIEIRNLDISVKRKIC